MDSSLNEHASGLLELKNTKVAEKRVVSQNNENLKRQRKNTSSSLCVIPMSFNVSKSPSVVKTKDKKPKVCKNLACRAILRREDTFCKRCSCCICLKFDNNKDTSLWLSCNSDPPFGDESCGFSWHLDCGFKSEKPSITEDKLSHDLDGCFSCVSCGKTNSLLECWKKQLTIAKETESVEVLFRRLLLARKLLKGTKKYREVHETVENAVKSLETELGDGSLATLSSSKCRGNVNKLRSSTEVKNLCCSALVLLDDQSPKLQITGSQKIIFKDVGATSVTLVIGSGGSSSSKKIIHHKIWHRMVSEKEYPKELTCELFTPDSSFVVEKLTPATEYCFKVVSLSDTKKLSVEEFKVSTQEEVTEQNVLTLHENNNNKGKMVSLETERVDMAVDVKMLGSFDLRLEQCVKVIRQLECSGYIEKEFREKFLTWFSLKAKPREALSVKGFIDGFKDDDPIAFVDQLKDTFSHLISRRRFAFGGGNGVGGSGASASASARF